MTAPFARFVESPGGTQPERRRFARQPASATALLRSAQGETSEVALTDVTTHGCCLRCDAGWLRAGAFVALELEEDPLLRAIIRWVRDGCAGLEFLREVPSEHAEWHALLDLSFGS